MESYFNALATLLDHAVGAGDRYTASFAAEASDFVRMNRGQVRQSGSVAQRSLNVRLIRGARHATHAMSLTGDVKADATTIERAVAVLRAALPELADDPHLLLPDDVVSTRVVHGAALPPTENVVAEVLEAARGLDLVGLLAAGPVYRGFANSDGQRNWHAATIDRKSVV